LTTLLLDSHALFWWESEPGLLSVPAAEAIAAADDLVVAPVTWFELAWLVSRSRITVNSPLNVWLAEMAQDVRTIPITPAIAATAASLSQPFPGDPIDRLIYATAIEEGLQLVTRDEPLRQHPHPRQITIW
jgi:PIN domain nuclease of toxin-antitoxin system